LHQTADPGLDLSDEVGGDSSPDRTGPDSRTAITPGEDQGARFADRTLRTERLPRNPISDPGPCPNPRFDPGSSPS
jgi:hypothetical protein